MKILFLDIDGVFIPERAYYMATQTRPIVKTFDPCVVGMVNRICKDTGAQLVIHSSWVRTALHEVPSVLEHMIEQGLLREYFHEDHTAKYRFSGDRWLAITDWLDDHLDDVEAWCVLDDDLVPRDWSVLREVDRGLVIQTDFDEGLTLRQFHEVRNHLR